MCTSCEDSFCLAGNFPPTIDNSTNVILARVGDPVQLQVMANDPDGDAVSFSLLQNIEGAAINQGEKE